MSTKFSKPIEELKKGQVISNVLKVINHDEKAISFKIDVLFPANWTSIGDATRLYTANPKDTIIVPIIILPTKLVNGNTEVLINVFLVDEDGRQIGNNFFTITTKKKVSWSIDLKNNSNYYFLNSENKKLDFNKLTHNPTCVIIGPEGDFSEEERGEILAFKGVQPIKINENILRSETAVISALSIVNYLIN